MSRFKTQHNLRNIAITVGVFASLLWLNVRHISALSPLGAAYVYSISSSSDDATQSVVGGLVDTSAGILVLGDFDGLTSTVVGLRFNNIEVPQGGVVTNARVSLTSTGAWGGSTTLFINGHDVGNSGTFSSANGPLDRVGQLTSSGVATSPGDWSSGVSYQSPDLSAILNEIFARPDWSFGNSLSLIIQDDGVANNVRREAVSVDGNPAQAPELSFDFSQEPDNPVGPGIQVFPDWVIADFTLTRENDCAENAPDECGISFQYQVDDLNGNSSFLTDVETNNVHIIDLSGQEYATGPHPGGTGFIPYSEFPSLAYADIMACGTAGLLAVIDGGVHGEVNTNNNVGIFNLSDTGAYTDVHYPAAPLVSWYKPSQHDLFSLLLPLQYFIQAPSTVDTPCLPLAMLGDYDVQMTVSIEGQQVAQYVESPGDVFWHLFGSGSARPQSGDDILIELLLNSDNGIEEGDYSNNTCQIHMTYQRRTANPIDVITHDYMTLNSTSGCAVSFEIGDNYGPSSVGQAITGSGAGVEDAIPSGQTAGLIIIVVVAFGGGLVGRRFTPAGGGSLVPTIAGAVVAAGIAAGAVAGISSTRSSDLARATDVEGAEVGEPPAPGDLDSLVRQEDAHPAFCSEFAHTYAENVSDENGEIVDILLHAAVMDETLLPPGSRYILTVADDAAAHSITSDESPVSLAAAGLNPESLDLPLVWQLQIESPAGTGGDLFLPLCFPDGWHSFDGESAMAPVSVPAPSAGAADNAAPTVTNIGANPNPAQLKNQQVTISAKVEDPSGVATVIVYFRTKTGGWGSARMTLTGGRYRAVIGPFATAGVWEFHIRAVDTLGNENCSASARAACPGGKFTVTPP